MDDNHLDRVGKIHEREFIEVLIAPRTVCTSLICRPVEREDVSGGVILIPSRSLASTTKRTRVSFFGPR